MVNKIKIAYFLGIIVMLTGVMVMIGWVFDIPALTSILPHWVTMKFSTALCFFLSGMVLWFITGIKSKQRSLMQSLLLIPCLTISLLMASLLVSTIFGTHTGIEDLFVKEATGAVKTLAPGRPSVGTMLSFLLIAGIGFLGMSSHLNMRLLFLLGTGITVLGGIAMFGYLLNIPLLYYTLEGWSTAMAFHTAILFILTGSGFILLGSK